MKKTKIREGITSLIFDGAKGHVELRLLDDAVNGDSVNVASDEPQIWIDILEDGRRVGCIEVHRQTSEKRPFEHVNVLIFDVEDRDGFDGDPRDFKDEYVVWLNLETKGDKLKRERIVARRMKKYGMK